MAYKKAEVQKSPLRFCFTATVLSHIISFVDLTSNKWALENESVC